MLGLRSKVLHQRDDQRINSEHREQLAVHNKLSEDVGGEADVDQPTQVGTQRFGRIAES